MSLTYSPKMVKPKLDAINAARDLDSLRSAVAKMFKDLADEQSQERQRMATALNATGGLRARYRAVTDDGFAASTDGTIAFDTTANDVEITLPLTTEYPGMTIKGVVIDASNASTFAPRTGDSIDGVAGPYTITNSVVLQADEITRNWVVVP